MNPNFSSVKDVYISYVKHSSLPFIANLERLCESENRTLNLDLPSHAEAVWEGLTWEYVEWLHGYLSDIASESTTILEVCCGSGLLSRCLESIQQQSGDNHLSFVATDNLSWKLPIGNNVQQLDAWHAINKIDSNVILCCWPPKDAEWIERVVGMNPAKTIVVIGCRERIFDFSHFSYTQLDAPPQFSFKFDETKSYSTSKTWLLG